MCTSLCSREHHAMQKMRINVQFTYAKLEKDFSYPQSDIEELFSLPFVVHISSSQVKTEFIQHI